MCVCQMYVWASVLLFGVIVIPARSRGTEPRTSNLFSNLDGFKTILPALQLIEKREDNTKKKKRGLPNGETTNT